MLGLIGEYVGRMFLDVSDKPQAVIRSSMRSKAGFEEQQENLISTSDQTGDAKIMATKLQS